MVSRLVFHVRCHLTHPPLRLQHGIKRSRVPPIPDSAEVERKKREKEAKRIEEYTGLVSVLREKVSHPSRPL